MSENRLNPWKLTAIGMVLMMSTALVTGLVVANWTGSDGDRKPLPQPVPPRQSLASSPARVASAVSSPAHAPGAPASRASAPAAPATPAPAVVDACNRQAAAEVGGGNKTIEVVKDAAIGAVVGGAVGAAGGAIAGGGKGAGKGAAIGGLVGAGGGTLYGLNENHKQDERYRAAYGSCLRARGYIG